MFSKCSSKEIRLEFERIINNFAATNQNYKLTVEMSFELIPDLHLTISIRFEFRPASINGQADKLRIVEEVATSFYWDFVVDGMKSRSLSLGEIDEDYSFALLPVAQQDENPEIIKAEVLIFADSCRAGVNEKELQEKISGWFGPEVEITFLDNQNIQFSHKTLHKLQQNAGYDIEFKEFKCFIDTKDDLLIRILYGGSGYFCSSSGTIPSKGLESNNLESINDAFYQALLDLGMQTAKDYRLGGHQDDLMCEIVDNYEVLELQIPYKRGIGTFGKNLHKTLKEFFGPKIPFEYDEHTGSFRFPENTRKLFNERLGYYLNIERVEICFAN
jgi:hypothetical protein